MKKLKSQKENDDFDRVQTHFALSHHPYEILVTNILEIYIADLRCVYGS